MIGLRNFLSKLKRPLFAQLLFTALAFIAMGVLSYLFASNMVHSYMVSRSNNILDSERNKIESDLTEPSTALGVFSESVRSLIMLGVDADQLKQHFVDQTVYIQEKSTSSFTNFNGFYGYFERLQDEAIEPIFINGIGWDVEDSSRLMNRPWLYAGKLGFGEIRASLPYRSWINDELVFAYARAIFGNDGELLGVVALDVQIDEIGKHIVEVALAQGGYGMLFDHDLYILSHPNKDYVGLNASDPELPLAGFARDMRSRVDISEQPIISYRGEESVFFSRRLSNGWTLGLVTPRAPYYMDVTQMAAIIFLFGIIFTAALMFILIRIDAARVKSDKESRHKSTFLANMSHEIRTPMNAIVGMTLIGKNSDNLERKDYCLTKIEDASHHLLGVINDILDMSKIEANKFDLSSSDFVFEKMLQRVVNVVNFRVDEKKQKLMIHLDSDIPRVLVGDEQRLAQVITNLLGNAIKFTPENGSINLDVDLKDDSDGMCTLLFAVTDTGIGISHEQQSHLFKSFQQADSETTRKYGGTGLGLSISKNIIEMMGGTIWIESELGKGASFKFTIRVTYIAESQDADSGDKQTLSKRNLDWFSLRTLVVDDDPDVLVYFKEIMQKFGAFCDIAHGGEDALQLVKQNGPYDIYFVDWMMPGMDGLTLANELKSINDDTIIIMISALEWRAIESEAKSTGIDRFLSKPLFASAIADAVNETIGVCPSKEDNENPLSNDDFSGCRILLAEDVEINREIVMSVLEPTNLTIDCAENGEEAVRIFSENPEIYDMIFMDVQMPGMDGYEATRRIRALDIPHAKTIPIMAMTANVFKEDIEMCLESGMDSHIGKPLNHDDLIEKLRQYLGNKNK